MRLIDADKVKELINGLDSLPWEEEVDDLVDSVPTAYDVEKVVAELEEASYEAKMLDAKCKYLNYDDTIHIVRNGGKE
jgi:hypothetical protein